MAKLEGRDFSRLLRESLSLVSQIDQEKIPTIHRNLAQLDAVSRKLAQRNVPKQHTPSDTPLDSQAQMFLAGSGLDITNQKRTLKSIDLSRTYESLEPISDLDVDKFLEHQHQMLINTAIEETTKMTTESFRKHYLSKMEEDWEHTKRDILDSIGYCGGLALPPAYPPATPHLALPMATPARSWMTPGLGERAPALPVPCMSDYAPFAEAVINLNKERVKGSRFPVISEFFRVQSNEKEGVDNEPMKGCWLLLQSMVGETRDTKSRRGDGGASVMGVSNRGEKHFQTKYLQGDSALKLSLIQGVKKYLENLFLDMMKQETRARRTSKEDSPIQAFVKLHARESSLVKNVWCRAFLSIRCGDLTNAIKALKEQKGITGEDRIVQECLEKLRSQTSSTSQQGLPKELWEKLNTRWYSLVNSKPDPYKVAVYAVLGKYDVEKIPEEIPDIFTCLGLDCLEDWIWFKLSIVCESSDSVPEWREPTTDKSHLLSLQSLQDWALTAGEKQFNMDGKTPLNFFRVLLMLNLFEQAVNYLVWGGDPQLVMLATHIAVALDYYGLLRVDNFSNNYSYSSATLGTILEESDSTPMAISTSASKTSRSATVNMARVLNKYIASFKQTNPVEAFHYLYLLHSTKPIAKTGDSKTSCGCPDVSHDEIVRLLLETSQYEKLVGTFKRTQVSKDGCLYKFFSGEDARHVIRAAAKEADRNGKYSDAIRLYSLAEDEELVAQILIKQLSKLVSIGARSNSAEGGSARLKLRQELVKYLDHFAVIFRQQLSKDSRLMSIPGILQEQKSQPPKSRQQLSEQLDILRGLVRFFDLYHFGPPKYDEALRVLESLRVIPTVLGEDSEEIMRRFQKIHPDLKINFAAVAVCCMEIYQEKYKTVMQEISRSRAASTSFAHATLTRTSQHDTMPTKRQQELQRIATEIGARARVLNNFMALQHDDVRMSGETISKLVQLEASMS